MAGRGTAAITQTLLTLLKPGDHVVHHRCLYPAVLYFLASELSKFDIQATALDLGDRDTLRATLRPQT